MRVLRLRLRPTLARRLGLALLAFGGIGLGLVVAGLLVAAGVGAATGPDARAELRATIADSRDALRQATVAARDSQRGLGAAGSAAGSTGTFFADLAGSLRTLSGAMRIEIPLVGTAPFAGVAGQFGTLADRADALATDLTTVNSSVTLAADDLTRLADDLDRLEAQLGRVSDAADSSFGGGIDQLRLVAVALLLWLAVPAAACVGVGITLLRAARRPAVATQSETPGTPAAPSV